MASTATRNPEFGVHTISLGLIDEEASYHSFRRGDARVILPDAATCGTVALAFSVRRKKVPPRHQRAGLWCPLKCQTQARSALLPRARNLRIVLAHGAVVNAEI